MKKLIINADDFGLSRSVNRGIITAHRKGVVTSATIMVNTPGFSEAVSRAKENPSLGVGVHLNLYRGKPLSNPASIPSLVCRDGNFFASSKLVKKIYLKKINPKEVQRELKAQIVKVRESGIAITHLDSEKHFHIFPIISSVVIKLADYFNIRKIRLPDEKWQPRNLGDLFSLQFYKKQYLAHRAGILRSLFQKQGIKHVDQFYGTMYTSKVSLGSFLEILDRVKHGISELMVHPGFVDQELREIFQRMNYSLLSSREQELKVLLNPEIVSRIRRLGIELINYRKL